MPHSPSILMPTLWQAFGSACGVRCGFHPTHRRVTTPLDFLLLATANLFPLDALLLAYLTVLVFGATVLQLHAHCGQASRAFCCVSSSHLRPRGSAASAIVLVAAHLLLAGFTLVTQVRRCVRSQSLFPLSALDFAPCDEGKLTVFLRNQTSEWFATLPVRSSSLRPRSTRCSDPKGTQYHLLQRCCVTTTSSAVLHRLLPATASR